MTIKHWNLYKELDDKVETVTLCVRGAPHYCEDPILVFTFDTEAETDEEHFERAREIRNKYMNWE